MADLIRWEAFLVFGLVLGLLAAEIPPPPPPRLRRPGAVPPSPPPPPGPSRRGPLLLAAVVGLYTRAMIRTRDLRIGTPAPGPPAILVERMPIPEASSATVARGREEIGRILRARTTD